MVSEQPADRAAETQRESVIKSLCLQLIKFVREFPQNHVKTFVIEGS